MKAVVAAFNQEKALVGAFSEIVQPVVEPMDRFAALVSTLQPQASILELEIPTETMQRMQINICTANTLYQVALNYV